MSYKDPEWLLTGDPRPGQLEALRRSFYGYKLLDHRDGEPLLRPLREGAARGWGHLMQPRVGKTPTLLNEFMLAKRDYGVKRLVVMSPNKFKWGWQADALRFGVDTDVFVHDRSTSDLAAALKKHEEGVFVVNYEALVQEKNLDALLAGVEDSPFMIGFDESVKAKNATSVTWKRSMQLAKEARFRRILSGKPAPQSPLDYFAQLRLIGAMDGWNQFKWRATFCKMGGFKMKKVVGPKNEERLASILDEWAFMAERRDWATFFESAYEEPVEIGMLPEQQRAYMEMERDFITWLADNTSVSVEMAGHRHMKLQQISSGFIYSDTGETKWLVPFDQTPKFLDLVERIEESVIDKVMIPYVFKPTGDALLDHLASYKPAFIGGEEAMRKRGLNVEAEKHRFNNDPECRVMVCQETAVKYGHTLMGTKENPCLDIIFFENSYSLDDRAQTEERPQGEGQVQALAITDYAASPVEKAVIKALQEKEKVSQVVWDHYKAKAQGGRNVVS